MQTIDITQSTKKTKQEKEYKEYIDELDKHIRYKQKYVDSLFNTLQTAEIDDTTSFLLADFFHAVATSWAIGKIKRKYAEKQGTKGSVNNA